MGIWKHDTSKRGTATAVAIVLMPRAVGRWLTNRLQRPGTAPSVPARLPSVPAQHRATRSYRALLELPAPADGETQDCVPWPTWRAVVRARHHETHGGGLFSALVSGPEAAAAPTDSHVVVTMVVVGDNPADFLGIGDEFDLWRGADVAHGVITWRNFV